MTDLPNPLGRCPRCDNTDIEIEDVRSSYNSDHAFRSVRCTDCESEWVNYYKHSYSMYLDTGEMIELEN